VDRPQRGRVIRKKKKKEEGRKRKKKEEEGGVDDVPFLLVLFQNDVHIRQANIIIMKIDNKKANAPS